MTSDGVLALGGLDRPSLVIAELDLELLARVRAYGEVFIRTDWDGQETAVAAGATTVRVE